MNRIVAYGTVTRYSAEGLVEEMTRIMGEGWQPLGGMSVSELGIYTMYVQAIARYEKRDAAQEMEMALKAVRK